MHLSLDQRRAIVDKSLKSLRAYESQLEGRLRFEAKGIESKSSKFPKIQMKISADSHTPRAHKVPKSMWESKAKQEWEFELLSTLISFGLSYEKLDCI